MASLRAQTEGTERWGFTTGGIVVSSPAIAADGTIIVGTNYRGQGMVLAIRPGGGLKWQFVTPDEVDSSPAIGSDGTVYVGCWDGKLYALNSNGGKKWEFDTGVSVYSSPAIGPDGTIYFGSGANALHALTPDGKEKWRKTVGDQVFSSPAIGPDGTIYFGSLDQYVYAVNPDGTEKWRVDAGYPVWSSPAVGRDGTLYIGTTGKTLLALTSEGKSRWVFATEGSMQASPVLGPDGTIYVGSLDWYFYAINADGTQRWRYYVNQPVASSAVVRADGTIIFGADDHRIRALDAQGKLVWACAVGDRVASSPAIASDGTIYVGADDNKLHALNGNGMAASDYASWPMFRQSLTHEGRAYSELTAGRLVNLSTRGQAGRERNLIVGFVVKGSSSRRFLMRAAGPALLPLGVAEALPDPNLTLRILPSGFAWFVNEDWEDEEEGPTIAQVTAAVGAFPFSAGSKDAALIGTIPAGMYGTVVGTTLPGNGVVLAEVYDTASARSENLTLAAKATSAPTATGLVNLSTRGPVGTGANILISGLVIGPGTPRRILVRAVGPGLAQFGVNDVLARPVLEIYSGSTLLQRNVGWTTAGQQIDLEAATSDVWAFPLEAGSADCAMLLTLNSGNYTLQVSGSNGTTGEAMVEIYVTP